MPTMEMFYLCAVLKSKEQKNMILSTAGEGGWLSLCFSSSNHVINSFHSTPLLSLFTASKKLITIHLLYSWQDVVHLEKEKRMGTLDLIRN